MEAETSEPVCGEPAGEQGGWRYESAFTCCFQATVGECTSGDELWELDEYIMYEGHGVNRQLMKNRAIICQSDCNRLGSKEPGLQ